MTVLVIFEDLQIALSDVMLSIEKRVGYIAPDPIPLPTIPSEKYDVSPVVPVRMVRKFIGCQIGKQSGKYLVSGTVSHVDKVVENIKIIRSGIGNIPDEMRQKLNTKDIRSVMDCACVMAEKSGYEEFECMGSDGTHLFYRKYDANTPYTMPYFGKVTLSGSGSEFVKKWLFERGEQFEKMSFFSESVIEKKHRTINWLSSLLLEEDTRYLHRTISEGVGGYYEIYDFSDGELQEIDDVVTIFLNVDDIRDDKIFIKNLFYHKYNSDILSVASLNNNTDLFNISDGIRINLSEFSKFEINPLYTSSSKTVFSKSLLLQKSANARLQRLCLFRTGESDDIYSVKRYYTSEHKIIKSTVKDEFVHYQFDDEIIRSIMDNFPKRPKLGQETLYSSTR